MAATYVVTKLQFHNQNFIFYGLTDGGRFYECALMKEDNRPHIGDIYVAKVKDVVPNIHAAFVEFEKDHKGFYSLDATPHIFLNRKNTDKVCQGDEILVQIEKEALKTKDPVLTSHINFAGKYVAFVAGKHGFGISSKIRNEEDRKRLRSLFEDYISEEYEIILRTNAGTAPEAEVLQEFQDLLATYQNLVEKAKTRTIYTKLFSKAPEYIERIKGFYQGEVEECVCDDAALLPALQDSFAAAHIDCRTRLYEDSLLPLHKLYSIEDFIEKLLEKKVWLKSGGYLIIEATEAMTVIDVNTGKCSTGKKMAETIYKVNLEAAKEIAYQLRVRNISGIILVDFINMSVPEHNEQLMEEFRKLCGKDPVKTTVVDMTKLGLVEVTRLKGKQTIQQMLQGTE